MRNTEVVTEMLRVALRQCDKYLTSDAFTAYIPFIVCLQVNLTYLVLLKCDRRQQCTNLQNDKYHLRKPAKVRQFCKITVFELNVYIFKFIILTNRYSVLWEVKIKSYKKCNFDEVDKTYFLLKLYYYYQKNNDGTGLFIQLKIRPFYYYRIEIFR